MRPCPLSPLPLALVPPARCPLPLTLPPRPLPPPPSTALPLAAAELACAAHEFYGEAVADVMPTLGTHAPMSSDEIAKMYPTIPESLFRVHDWREDTVVVGVVPAEVVKKESDGKVAVPWRATLNKLVHAGGCAPPPACSPHPCVPRSSFQADPPWLAAAGCRQA